MNSQETRPTYFPVPNPDGGPSLWRTSDGSTFLTEADARLHADPDPTLAAPDFTAEEIDTLRAAATALERVVGSADAPILGNLRASAARYAARGEAFPLPDDGCSCGHRRDQHQSGEGAWTGFCSGTLGELGGEYVRDGDDPAEPCSCEGFVASGDKSDVVVGKVRREADARAEFDLDDDEPTPDPWSNLPTDRAVVTVQRDRVHEDPLGGAWIVDILNAETILGTDTSSRRIDGERTARAFAQNLADLLILGEPIDLPDYVG